MALAVPAFAAADWGAIAVSPRTGKVGVSYDYSTAHHAKQRALHECHQLGCRVAVWVANQYAALVLKPNGVFVAGVGLTRTSPSRRRRSAPTNDREALRLGLQRLGRRRRAWGVLTRRRRLGRRPEVALGTGGR